MKTLKCIMVALLALLPIATGTAFADSNKNDKDNPIFVIGGTPIHAVFKTQGDTTGVIYTVPNGKRLHIQFISFGGTKKTAQTRVNLQVLTTLESTEIQHDLVKIFDFDSEGGFYYSKSVNLYAGPNTHVTLRVVGNLGTPLSAWGGTIAGRLEPVPD